MKRIFCLFLTIVFMTGLAACGQSVEEQWQEQYDLGVRYLSEGNYEEAIIAFTAAIEIDPKRAEAYVGRGDAYIGSGETEERLAAALADYEKALDLDKTLVDAWVGIANVYISMGEYDKAIEIVHNGVIETDDETLKSKLEEIQEQFMPSQITVLTRQSFIKYDYIKSGNYGDENEFTEGVHIYQYDEEGYLTHMESWLCSYEPWTDESDEWILTSSEDRTYDQGLDQWIVDTYRRYGGDSQHTRDHIDLGTSTYTLGSDGNVCISCDPYPAERLDTVYNSEYGDDDIYNYDWYAARYTYDADGNAIRIESYSIDGELLGICELEYETLKLK